MPNFKLSYKKVTIRGRDEKMVTRRYIVIRNLEIIISFIVCCAGKDNGTFDAVKPSYEICKTEQKEAI